MNCRITSLRASAELVNRLNAVSIAEYEIVEAIRAAIEASDAGESYAWCSIGTTMQLFAGAPQKGRAVIFRLQALARMMEENQLKDWMLPDGSRIIPAAQKALIIAVATHPLSLIDGCITFEKESFLQKILEFAEAPGSQACC